MCACVLCMYTCVLACTYVSVLVHVYVSVFACSSVTSFVGKKGHNDKTEAI